MSEIEKTLILKTEGMSAYGLQTFDVHRRVSHFPTRSAVMGLLGASVGITRAQHVELYELSNRLKIAVQVNHCGEKIIDYHTVQNFRSPQGKIQSGTKPTYREYWCDSEHTFAITGKYGVISDLERCIKSPKFSLFQGRKSCPLTRPLFEKVTDDNNPADSLLHLGGVGQIFSDVKGGGHIAILQVRDMTTQSARKYSMRTVYVCARPILGQKGVGNELTT